MNYVNKNDLQPGDVLLCGGGGSISYWICLLDGGPYSHAAFYQGEHIVHATLSGIKAAPLTSLSEENFVDVYRFDKDGHHFGDEGYPVEPVVAVGDRFAAEAPKYATDHLLLLAVLVATRKIKSKYKVILRIVFDNLFSLIAKMLDKGEKPMVCSELVFRCFDEAAPEEKYTLKIKGSGYQCTHEANGELTKDALLEVVEAETGLTEKSLSAEELQIEAEFEEAKNKFMQIFLEAHGEEVPTDEDVLMANFEKIVATWVTPSDLKNSPSLVKVGRLLWD